MSRWAHVICERCWRKREPLREPVRVSERIGETCCFCGADTWAGIYVRENPNETLCKGNH